MTASKCLETRVRYKEQLPSSDCEGEIQKRECTSCDAKNGARTCTDWIGTYTASECMSGCGTMKHNELNVSETRTRWGTPFNFFRCVEQRQIKGSGQRCVGTSGGTQAQSNILSNFFGWCVASVLNPNVCDDSQTMYWFVTCTMMWPPMAPPSSPPVSLRLDGARGAKASPPPPIILNTQSLNAQSPPPTPLLISTMTTTQTSHLAIGMVAASLFLFCVIVAGYTLLMKRRRMHLLTAS